MSGADILLILFYAILLIIGAYLIAGIAIATVKGTWALGNWIFHNSQANALLQLAMVPIWLVMVIASMIFIAFGILLTLSNLSDFKDWLKK